MATREIKIEVPNGYEAITLRKYLELQDDLKAYGEEPEAQTAAMFYHLCGLTPELLAAIDIQTFNKIKDKLFSFVGKSDYELVKFITIDGVEYGFEPNISKMPYGAYIDISKYQTMTIDDNWASIMSILYRPVLDKKGDMYHIAPYTGEIDKKKFLDVGMHVHFGALFFFVNLSMDLMNAILKSLKVEELPPNIKLILERSGEVMQRLLKLQTTTSLNLKQ
jgi:hypothetical protein